MFGRIVSSARTQAVQSVKSRSFASAAQAEKVQLPVQLYGLSARYANAIYSAATKGGSIAAVEKDFAAVEKLIEEVPTFKAYLENPVISRKDKVADIQKISAGMDKLTQSFLCVLAENGRLSEFSKISSTFGQLLNAQRGLVEATVVSAQPLTSAQQSQLDSALKSFTKEGEQLKVQHAVNPEIIGGLQVQVGDRFIDLSIQSKINKMWKSLKEAKN